MDLTSSPGPRCGLPSLLDVLHAPGLAGLVLCRCDVDAVGALRLTSTSVLTAVRREMRRARWQAGTHCSFPEGQACPPADLAHLCSCCPGLEAIHAMGLVPIPAVADACLVSTVGAAAVSRVAAWPTSLLLLDLSCNSMGDEGAAALARCAPPPLRVLRLAYNSIGPHGCESLARAPWPYLLELDCSANPLGDDGAERLAAQLSAPRLRRLSIASAGVGARGAAALLPLDGSAVAACCCPALRELDARCHTLGADEGQELERRCRQAGRQVSVVTHTPGSVSAGCPFKGVGRCRSGGGVGVGKLRWTAYVWSGIGVKRLGTYDSEADAALAYDAAVRSRLTSSVRSLHNSGISSGVAHGCTHNALHTADGGRDFADTGRTLSGTTPLESPAAAAGAPWLLNFPQLVPPICAVL